MHILIVDDDVINSKMLSKRLEKRAFEVSVVNNGTKCLEFVEDVVPDLILLDIMMPDLSGTEVLLELRKKYSASELPIVMVTAKSETTDVVEALKSGANDFIQKPVNIDVCVARVQAAGNLSQFYKDSLRKKELETVNAMIITYNHEINNPLTIAMGLLKKAQMKEDYTVLTKVDDALVRIADIVKKIDKVSQNKNVSKDDYVKGQKMIKLK